MIPSTRMPSPLCALALTMLGATTLGHPIDLGAGTWVCLLLAMAAGLATWKSTLPVTIKAPCFGALLAVSNLCLHALLTPPLPPLAPFDTPQPVQVRLEESLRPGTKGWTAKATLLPARHLVTLYMPYTLMPPAAKEIALPAQILSLGATLIPPSPDTAPRYFSPSPLPLLVAKDLISWPASHTSYSPWQRITQDCARVRHRIMRRLSAQLSALDAALIKSLILGQKGELPPEFRASLDATGTSHLLAISGLHLGAVMALLWGLGTPLVARTRLAHKHGVHRALALPVCVLMGLYVVLVGAPVSARRALGMCLTLMGAQVWLRRIKGAEVLGLVVAGMILWDPEVVAGAGFWLSVGATGGIVLALGHTTHPPSPPKQALRACLGAFLGTLPMTLLLRWEVPLVGLALNLGFIPVVTALIFPATILGLAGLWVWPAAGEAVLGWSAGSLVGLQQIASAAMRLPGGIWRPGELPFLAIALISCGCFGLLWARHHVARGASLALVLVPLLWPQPLQKHSLLVEFLPVGQGDATLIRFGDGRTMLVDAGGLRHGRDPGLHHVMPRLRSHGITHLDLALATHADLDHVRGFYAIALLATPRRFLYDPRQHHDYAPLLTHLLAQGSGLEPVTHSHSFTWADTKVEVLYPPAHPDKNEMSLVVLLHHAGRTVLLPGDLEDEGEAWLIDALTARGITSIDVLKAPHHGSATSSTQDLVDHTSPPLVVVSCGVRNTFGHPHKDVVARWMRRGSTLARTDHHGIIALTIDQAGTLDLRLHQAHAPVFSAHEQSSP